MKIPMWSPGGFRKVEIPSHYQSRIEGYLETQGFSLKRPRELADGILRLSDHYAQADRLTPWHEPWARAAYASYFFVLNYARLRAVFGEAQRLGFLPKLDQLVDVGAGPGTGSLAFSDQVGDPFETLAIEPEDSAQELARALEPDKSYSWARTHTEVSFNSRKQMVLFSYALNEMGELPRWADAYEAVVIVEPSTHARSRALQALRVDLQKRGFSIWGPCTHQQDCPLLVHSEKDWCHDRIHFVAPHWFQQIEQHLPIKNKTLTYSYLLARKTPAPEWSLARMTGDQLIEKGKTRQLICRNSNREFLTWMKRMGNMPEISRGALVKLDSELATKGNELRPLHLDQVQVIE